MKTTWSVLLSVLAGAMLLLASDAWADAAGPGSCFGSSDHKEIKNDAGIDGKDAMARGPSSSSTRRTGVGLLSAGFVMSGWLFLRRTDRKG